MKSKKSLLGRSTKYIFGTLKNLLSPVDGSKHEAFTRLVVWAFAIWQIYTGTDLFACVLLAILTDMFGRWLSPDLDLSHRSNRKCKSYWRWNKAGAGFVWELYSRSIPRHRHLLSHAPIISTIWRLPYFAIASLRYPKLAFDLGLTGLAIAGISILFPEMAAVSALFAPWGWIGYLVLVLIAMEVATSSHAIVDLLGL